MTTSEADEEEPGPEPQPASSPPAAAVPAISLSASRRDMRRCQGEDLSLGWNAISTNLLSGPSEPLPYPSAASSSCPAPSSLSPVPAHQGRSPTPWPPHQDTSRWPVLRSPPGRRTTPAAPGHP